MRRINSISQNYTTTHFLTLGQEQIYATVLYYLQNREKIGNYLNEWIEHGKRMRELQEKNPPPVILRLRKIAAERKRFHI